MKRWTPALVLLWLWSPSWAGDVRSLEAPEPLPADKPLVAPLDPSAPLGNALPEAQRDGSLPLAAPTELPQSAILNAAAVSPTAQARPLSAQKNEGAASSPAQAPESNQWSGIFDGARAAQPLALDRAGAAPDRRAVAALVARLQRREFPGVAIQQEHEGNLLAPDTRDSFGDAYTYYRPVDLRPELVEKVKAGMGKLEKLGYWARRLTSRDDWTRFATKSKLRYLAALEQAVGSDKAWKGRTSLLLVRAPSAPNFIDEHPQMEEAPTHDYDGLPYKRYLFPEIVTAKDAPARSVEEAIDRAQLVVGDTAHAGIHYHVFFTMKSGDLARRLPEIENLLQLANDAYFAEGTAGNPLNLANRALSPWHDGRSRRVESLIARGEEAPSASNGTDPDSEKHVPLAFRYWGTKDGRATVSFELRAVGIPWARRGGASEMVRGIESDVTLERDYSEPARRLAFVSLFADALLRGRPLPAAIPRVVLDEAAVDRLAAARAKALGIPDGAYVSIGDFSRAVFGTPRDMDDVLQGLLLPFAAGADEPSARAARAALLDEFLKQSARVRSLQRDPAQLEEQKRAIQRVFWSAYVDWAKAYAAARESRLDRLFLSLQ